MTLSLRTAARGILASALFVPAIALAADTASSQNVIKSGEHVRGRPRAQVTMVMYSDFQCPYCQQTHPVLMKVMRKYRNKVNLIYRHYPLPGHPHAQSAAEASECAAYLGGNNAFWGFADTLFEMKKFTPADYVPLAQRFGIDKQKFINCVNSRMFASKVEEQRKGGDSAGVQGTPTVFIISRPGKYQETVAGAEEIGTYALIVGRMLDEIKKGATASGSTMR